MLFDEPDQLYWRWSANGAYSAQSCYQATFQGSTVCYSWKLIWKSWVPSTSRVKFFHWLANQDRSWTAERLARRGLQHHPPCLPCDQAPATIRHLLPTCPFTRESWHTVFTWLRISAPVPEHEASLMEWWLQRKALRSIALLVPCMLWKHTNACVFDHVNLARRACTQDQGRGQMLGKGQGSTALGHFATIMGCPLISLLAM